MERSGHIRMMKLNHLLLCIRFVRTMKRKPLPIPQSQKRLDIVIMGEPNVGKSVLMNALIKTKLAATSRKRHTTRQEILGVTNHRNTQLAFYDTPGFVAKGDAVKAGTIALSEVAEASANKADVVMIVIDSARSRNQRTMHAFSELVKIAIEKARVEIILVLNKVDLVEPKIELLDATRDYVSLVNGVKLGPEKAHLAALDTTVFMVSALKNDGVLDIKNYLISIAPFKPWIIEDKAASTDMREEERVEQMVLESLMENTHEEIPYIAQIFCTSINKLNEQKLRIDVDIMVDSASQQRIIVGQQGRTLVKIRQASVEQLEKIFKKEVILFLWIKQRGKDSEST